MFNIPGLNWLDLQILQMYQENANVPPKQMAKVLHRSLSVIYARTKTIKENGYTLPLVYELNYEKIPGILIINVMIGLRARSENSLTYLKEIIFRREEVMECYQLIGKYDYKLKIVVPNMDMYNSIYKELSEIPFLDTIETHAIIAEFKNKTSIRLI